MHIVQNIGIASFFPYSATHRLKYLGGFICADSWTSQASEVCYKWPTAPYCLDSYCKAENMASHMQHSAGKGLL